MQKGFTLVELAIVIVVLGILISGVIAGQSLINSSKRQSVISEVQMLKTSIRAFQLEYDAIPGDFDEAEEYFSMSGISNGDDNRKIAGTTETSQAMRHLLAAELVTKMDPASPSIVFCAECYFMPADYGKGSFFGLGGVWSSHSNPFDLNSGGGTIHGRLDFNLITLAKPRLSDSNDLRDGAVNNKDALYIDKKIDDANPSNGSILAANSGAANSGCVNGQYFTANVSYTIDEDYDGCRLFFRLDRD